MRASEASARRGRRRSRRGLSPHGEPTDHQRQHDDVARAHVFFSSAPSPIAGASFTRAGAGTGAPRESNHCELRRGACRRRAASQPTSRSALRPRRRQPAGVPSPTRPLPRPHAVDPRHASVRPRRNDLDPCRRRRRGHSTNAASGCGAEGGYGSDAHAPSESAITSARAHRRITATRSDEHGACRRTSAAERGMQTERCRRPIAAFDAPSPIPLPISPALRGVFAPRVVLLAIGALTGCASIPQGSAAVGLARRHRERTARVLRYRRQAGDDRELEVPPVLPRNRRRLFALQSVRARQGPRARGGLLSRERLYDAHARAGRIRYVSKNHVQVTIVVEGEPIVVRDVVLDRVDDLRRSLPPP